MSISCCTFLKIIFLRNSQSKTQVENHDRWYVSHKSIWNSELNWVTGTLLSKRNRNRMIWSAVYTENSLSCPGPALVSSAYVKELYPCRGCFPHHSPPVFLLQFSLLNFRSPCWSETLVLDTRHQTTLDWPLNAFPTLSDVEIN